jgi:hypothetical protein
MLKATQASSGFRILAAAAAGLFLFSLTACQYADPDTAYPRSKPGGGGGSYEKRESVFGGDGLQLFGNSDKNPAQAGGSGIGVNSFLWRASLDTISFMPLSSADPFGGVIITDWYSPPETKAERVKVNVYILGRDLRADGIRASVFRQVQNGSGAWVDADVRSETSADLENAILSRARQLRIASVQ